MSFHLYQYSLPFKETFSLKGRPLNVREGLILQIKDELGNEGFGEIAPLPGFSEESLESAKEQILEIMDEIKGDDIPEFVENLDGKFFEWFEDYALYPSVQFGLESAIINLIANSENKQVNKLLSASGNHDHISLNGLLQGNKTAICEQAKEMLKKGFKSFKLKVGGEVSEDIEKVLAVNEVIKGKALLHCDANKQWSFDQAIEFANHTGIAIIDYIEEPLNDIKRIPEFFEKTDMFVAYDESITGLSLKELTSTEGVDVIVLKPMLLGGLEKSWQIMQHLQKVALNFVISSSFESEIGILTLAELAGSIARNKSAGLDTLKWFDHNLLKEPLTVTHGSIDITSRMIKSDQINFEQLTKIV